MKTYILLHYTKHGIINYLFKCEDQFLETTIDAETAKDLDEKTQSILDQLGVDFEPELVEEIIIEEISDFKTLTL